MRWLTMVLLVAGACADPGPATGVTDARFVATMVALRQAAQAAGTDTAAFVAARERILAEQQVTEAELREYVELHAADLAHMAAIWDSVHARLTVEAEP